MEHSVTLVTVQPRTLEQQTKLRRRVINKTVEVNQKKPNSNAIYAGLRNFRYKIVNTKSVLYSQKKITSEKRSKIKSSAGKAFPNVKQNQIKVLEFY